MVLLNLRNFRAHRRLFIKNHFAVLRLDHVLFVVGSPVVPVAVVLFWLLLI